MAGKSAASRVAANADPVRASPTLKSGEARRGLVLQRRCACGGTVGPSGECAACRRKRLDRERAAATPDSVGRVMRDSGKPIEPQARALMEARFGHDFGSVRIHADAAADESARAVGAIAWSAGSRIAFRNGAYQPATPTGRHVLAHELAHVVQNERSGNVAAPAARLRKRDDHESTLEIGAEDSPAEREADRVADQVMRGGPVDRAAAPPAAAIQRMVFVKPAAMASDMLGHFEKMCPGKFATQSTGSAAQIVGDCKAKDRTKNKSCECLCDTAHDRKRTYTITVSAAVASEKEETLHDGSKAKVPVSTVFPSTFVGENPDINMNASKGSTIEFGAFQPDGKPFWYENWRILAHELCGHGRLKQSGAKGESTGCRAGHDATIDTENEIGAEHGSPTRGNFSDPRQGESFMNATGKRGKVLFKQCVKGKKGGGSELHFEAP